MNGGHKKARVGALAIEVLQMSLQSVFGSKSQGNNQSQEKFMTEPQEYHKSDKTSFAKHLRWKISTKVRIFEWMLITPEMAEEMLKYNKAEGTPNRPLSEVTARKYGRLMKEGRWGHNGLGTCEPIIFSDRARILSAQHRLEGCFLLGASFWALVIFGEPDENFAYIDQGRRRTAGDVFAINQVPNYLMAAAVVRWLVAYERNQIGNAHSSSIELSNQEAYEAYQHYPDLQTSIKTGLKYNRDRLPHPAVAAAIHYLCAQKSRRAADEYFEKIATGVGFSKQKEPAKKVRDFLTRQDIGQINRKMVAAALIQGWNMVRTNRMLTRVNPDLIETIV